MQSAGLTPFTVVVGAFLFVSGALHLVAFALARKENEVACAPSRAETSMEQKMEAAELDGRVDP